MRDLKALFDELVPRLETAQALERELDAHLARRFNVLDYLRTDELGLSRIVADLLNPGGKHGQGATFLKVLLDGCRLEGHIPLAAATAVEVEVEKTIKVRADNSGNDDDRRLDICVCIDSHCLAIENKPYAGDQPRQVRAYLDWLRNQSFKKYALIYLSPAGDPPDSVEPSYLENAEGCGHFKIMPYYSADDHEWEDGFDEYRLKYTLADWLADCRKNCTVDRLCWFLREAETFCTRRFGGHTVGDNEFEKIKNFVIGEHWHASLAVYEALPKIMRDVSKSFLKKVWNTWPEDYPYKDPDNISGYWDCPDRTKGYLYMYRESWKSARGGSDHRKYTQIRLEAVSGISRWSIGIKSANPELIGKGQGGFDKLRSKLDSEIGRSSEPDLPNWVWWRWIDEYSSWEDLIPQLHKECKESGKITRYFVRELAKVAHFAMPIIDKYEGP